MIIPNSVFSPEEEEELVKRNWSLIVSVAKKFQSTIMTLDDSISIASEGYIKALRSYDPAKGTKLSTYCTYVMRNALIDEKRRLLSKMTDKNKEFYTIYSLDVNIEEFASNSESTVLYQDRMHESMEELELVEEGFSQVELSTMFESLFKKLPEDEYQAVYYFYIKGMTQTEIAKLMNTTQPNVSKKIDTGLKRLRRMLVRSLKE